jgi:hypothetical protein
MLEICAGQIEGRTKELDAKEMTRKRTEIKNEIQPKNVTPD